MRINEVFVFKHRALLVYPDDSKKPPVGQGFNRPAIVTLEKVYPVRRDTKERITKPHLVARYEQKLKDRPGLRFLSYDHQLGEWSFYVDSFDAEREESPLSPKSPIEAVSGTLDTPMSTATGSNSLRMSPPVVTPISKLL